jgi:tRNA threonylcarbamoyladenosine biosynthesis protein TsaB
VLPVLDAKRSCFFAAFYRGGQRLTDFLDESPLELVKTMSKITACAGEPVLLTGSGAQLFYSMLEGPSPEYLKLINNIKIDGKFSCGRAKELLKMSKSAKFDNINDIEGVPVYLRKSDAELNRKKDGGDK